MPEYLGVHVPTLDPAEWDMANNSTSPHEVVVPVPALCTHKTTAVKTGLDNLASFTYQEGKTELAFALTYHKAQGASLDHVILDLLPRAMHYTLPLVTVGLSRVRQQARLRLLLDGPTHVSHLTSLTHDPHLVTWMHSLVPVPRAAPDDPPVYLFSLDRCQAVQAQAARDAVAKAAAAKAARKRGGGGAPSKK